MTQPKFAPILEQHEVREFAELAPPAPWQPHRPGETTPRPERGRPAGRGVPGPDQGYALKLAERFEDRLALEPDEHVEDVLAGAVAIALCRAALFGRAPVSADIELALVLFGYLIDDGARAVATVPAELVAYRRSRLSGAAHEYWRRRALADEVPSAALAMTPAAAAELLAAQPDSWRELVGA